MPAPIVYFLKLSISLSLVWLFYQLLLRRLTFYNWNRWFLLGYSLLSFLIPLINIGPILEKSSFQGLPMIQYLPVLEKGGSHGLPSPDGFLTPGHWNIIFGALALGSLFLLLRLLTRWISLYKIRGKAMLIRQTDMRIYQVDEPILPFSFGNSIYINQKQHTEEEWTTIILHEYVHIRQKHSVDILLAEMVCIVSWYNPFAWLIRYSIRQNLEFIADHKVVEKGMDKKGYQYHLLKVIGESRFRLANNFNFSSLKKRIVMMNRIKSTRFHLVKFLFLLPMLVILLLAFRDRYENSYETVLPGHADRTHSLALPGSMPQLILLSGTLYLRPDSLHLRRETLLPGRDTLPQPAGDGYQGAPFHIEKGQGNTSNGVAPLLIGLRSDTLHPLHILNGEPMPENWSVSSIPETEIKSVDVLKGDQAIRLFGAKGAGGVIAITTKDGKMYGEKDREEMLIILTQQVKDKIAQKVKDMAQITPDKAQITPDKAQIIPDMAQIKPDKARIKVDTAQVMVENAIKVILLSKSRDKIGIKADTIILSDKKKE